jgi:hypothetical protein
MLACFLGEVTLQEPILVFNFMHLFREEQHCARSLLFQRLRRQTSSTYGNKPIKAILWKTKHEKKQHYKNSTEKTTRKKQLMPANFCVSSGTPPQRWQPELKWKHKQPHGNKDRKEKEYA